MARKKHTQREGRVMVRMMADAHSALHALRWNDLADDLRRAASNQPTKTGRLLLTRQAQAADDLHAFLVQWQLVINAAVAHSATHGDEDA